MSEWKPGWVIDMHHQLVKIEKGQRWGYFPCIPDDVATSINPGNLAAITQMPVDMVLPLTVISTSPCGEVVLRPANPGIAEQMFPLKESTFKGKATVSREHCPFVWVEERLAKGSKGEYQTGDLLANEAWTFWSKSMHLHQGFFAPRT